VISLALTSSFDDRFRVVVAVALIVGLGALSLTATFARFQRHRAFALISSAGGVAIPLGILLGPLGLDLITNDVLVSARPLAMIALTWVGVIVGLQARRAIFAAVPKHLWRWALVDAVICGGFAAFAAIASLMAHAWWHMSRPIAGLEAAVVPVVALAIVTIGWSPETRSLRLRVGYGVSRVRVLVQAGSGLASLVAVVALGIAASGLGREELLQRVVEFSVAIVCAIGIAFGCRPLLSRHERGQPETTLVLLGALALLSGVAEMLDAAPLFVGGVCGATLANLGSPGIRNLEDTIRRAEPALAVFFLVVAGALMHGADLLMTMLFVSSLLAIRFVVKPGVALFVLRSEASALETELPLRSLPLRQAPIAVVVVVSLVLASNSSTLRSLLIATGIAGPITALAMVVLRRRTRRQLIPHGVTA